MAGPIAYRAPGKRSVTACAITCAVECRSTSRPSGVAGVTIVTAASWSIGRSRSTHSPWTLAASASLARRLPIDAAPSAAVTPRGYSRCEPSGSLTLTASAGLISLATISAAIFRSPLLGRRDNGAVPPIAIAPKLLSWASELDEQTLAQAPRTARLPIIDGHVALMPDAHLGIGATLGSVIPTRDAIIPAAVGVDIGCGVIAVETDLLAEHLPDSLNRLLREIERRIPAGVGHGHGARTEAAAHWFKDRDPK